jgi:carbon storage regulator
MLVLSRKPGEQIQIGHNITVTVIEVRGNRVKVGIEAPRTVDVVRGELQPRFTPVGQVATSVADNGSMEFEISIAGN